eukprot:Nitzschia sp. Nitz4//scaffold93_size78505//39271//40594//NITZ4_005421-RA/size78505-snap-gene-0.6-mRNA-1//-1//CDS//3329560291//4592//frame0
MFFCCGFLTDCLSATTAIVGYLLLGKDDMIRWTKRGGLIVGKTLSTFRIALQNVQAGLKSPEQVAELERAQRELAMSLGLPPNTIVDFIQKYQPPPATDQSGMGKGGTASVAPASSGGGDAPTSTSDSVMTALGKIPFLNSPSYSTNDAAEDQHIILSKSNVTSLTANGTQNVKVFRRRRRRPAKEKERKAAAAPVSSSTTGSEKVTSTSPNSTSVTSRQMEESEILGNATTNNMTVSDVVISNTTSTETSASSSSSDWAQRRKERLSRLTQRLESDGTSTSDAVSTTDSAVKGEEDEWTRQRQARLERLQGTLSGSSPQQPPQPVMDSNEDNVIQDHTSSPVSTATPSQDTISALQAQLATLDREREAEEARLQQEFQRREKMAQDYYITKKKLLEEATSTLGGGTTGTTATTTDAATKDSETKDEAKKP